MNSTIEVVPRHSRSFSPPLLDRQHRFPARRLLGAAGHLAAPDESRRRRTRVPMAGPLSDHLKAAQPPFGSRGDRHRRDRTTRSGIRRSYKARPAEARRPAQKAYDHR